MITLYNFPELKTALRIDGSEDDEVLALLLNAAKAYLSGAGVPEDKITSENLGLYKQSIILYIGVEYEYEERKIAKLERAFQRILLQLRAGIPIE